MLMKSTVEILPVAGYRKLINNMTCILFKQEATATKELLIVDSGKGISDIPANMRILDPQSLANLQPCYPSFDVLVPYMKQGYKITGVFITHAHGDHVGGVVALYDFLKKMQLDVQQIPCYGSTLTHAIGQKANGGKWPKNCVTIDQGSVQVTPNLHLQLFPLNHSVCGTTGALIKTGDKRILYLPDHRIDYDPVIGHDQVSIFEQIKQLCSPGIDACIIESTRAGITEVNRSEREVYTKLYNTLCYNSPHAETILVSTYATNPSRLLAVLDAAERSKRKVFLYGTSMKNLVGVYFKLGLFPEKFKKLIEHLSDTSFLNKNKAQRIILCTGHQGQYLAGLSKLSRRDSGYRWSSKDLVIFASTTIPKPGPIFCRNYLIQQLHSRRVRVLQDIHTSGHVSAEDLRITMNLLKPFTKIWVVNHGDYDQMVHMPVLAASVGIPESQVIIGSKGKKIFIE